MKSHAQALQTFARSLTALLMVRGAVRWITLWFFVWGVVVLAVRIGGVQRLDWLLLGLLGALPLAAVAAIREQRKAAEFSRVRATYDRLNQCGGLIMAEEAAEMSAWQSSLPRPSTPALRWRSSRAFGLLALSALFVGVTLCLPNKLTSHAAQSPLEIGKLVGELRAEVTTLKEEKILEEKKADELQKQLSQLKDQSSSIDPSKTWEALDHIKESNSDLARQAAEEALSKTASLAEAETLASALQMASEAGLSQETATQAAQDLAGMLKAAKLEEGLLSGRIPQELLSQLSSLSKEDLAKLLAAIQGSKSGLGRTVTNLANLKLIDAKLLSQCNGAGQCPNPSALAKFLSSCTNGCSGSICQLAMSYCRGGISRGRGDAPMTWKEETSAENTKFKENVLPSSQRLTDSQFVGVSRTAPELSGENVVAESGALANAQAGGGAANAQVVLPRHKQAVQRFFKRDQ
jgi:hypothetical protein